MWLLGFVLFPALAEQCIASLAEQEASSQTFSHSSLGTRLVITRPTQRLCYVSGEKGSDAGPSASGWAPAPRAAAWTLRVGVDNLRLGAGPGTRGCEAALRGQVVTPLSRPNHERLQTSSDVHWGQNHTRVTARL